MRMCRFLLIASIVISASAANVSANLMLRQHMLDRPVLSIELARPLFKDDPFATWSGAAELGIRWPVSSHVGLIAEIPVATAQLDDSDYGRGTVLGNILIGVDLGGRSGLTHSTTLSLLVQLPTADQPTYEYSPNAEYYDAAFYRTLLALMVGNAADYYDIARFQPYYWAVSANIGAQWQIQNGQFGFEFGPTALVTRGDEGENELLVHYGFGFGLGSGQFQFAAEYAGLFIAAEDPKSFFDRFDHVVSLGLEFPQAPVHPAIYYQRVLDNEYSDFDQGSVHFRLEIPLGTPKN